MRVGQPKGTAGGQRLFAWLMVAAVVCLLVPRRITDCLDHLVAMLVAPLSQGGQKMSLAVSDTLGKPLSAPVSAEAHRRLREDYHSTRAQLINLSQLAQQQQELIAQLSGLRQAFGLAQPLLITAEVVGSDSSNWRRIKQLNRGSLEQIQPGQMVLGASGWSGQQGQGEATNAYEMSVVGRVHRVGLKTAQVQLVNDPEFSLEVVVVPAPSRKEAWRAGGILRGEAMGEMKVSMVRVQDHPVKPGDAVLVRAAGTDLPIDLLLGTVDQCRRDDQNPVMWAIKVKSGVDLASLRKVVVVGAARD